MTIITERKEGRSATRVGIGNLSGVDAPSLETINSVVQYQVEYPTADVILAIGDVLYAEGDSVSPVTEIPTPFDTTITVDERFLTCTSTSVTPVGASNRLFNVTANFLFEPDPVLDLPDQINIDFSEFQYEVQFDGASGDRLVNSAGDPFDPAPSETEYVLTYNIVQNLTAAELPDFDDYINTTNNSSVTLLGETFPAENLLLRKLGTSGPLYGHDGSIYYPLVFNILTLPFFMIDSGMTWKTREILDMGYRELYKESFTAPITKVKIVVNDEAIATPGHLDGAGKYDPTPTDPPESITYEPISETNWAPLNLPSAIQE